MNTATDYSNKHPRRVVENYDETPKAGSGVAANTQNNNSGESKTMFNTKHAKSQYSEWTGVKAREVAERPLTLKDFEIYQLNGNAAAIAIFEELKPEKKKVYLTPNMIGQLHGLSRDDENIIKTGGVRVMLTFTKSKYGREYGTIVDAPAEE